MSTSKLTPTMASDDPSKLDPIERRRRIRRNVWWLAALALAFYLGFIAMSVSNGLRLS